MTFNHKACMSEAYLRYLKSVGDEMNLIGVKESMLGVGVIDLSEEEVLALLDYRSLKNSEKERMPRKNKTIYVNERSESYLQVLTDFFSQQGLSERRKGLIVLKNRFSHLALRNQHLHIDYVYLNDVCLAKMLLAGKTYACAAFEQDDVEVDENLRVFIHSLVA